MLIIAETKLDESYPDALFKVDNYHFWRKDRTSHGGGLLMYVRSDIACDRKDKLEFKCIDSIMVDIYINIRKWIITGVYRPPSIKDEHFSNDFISTCDKLSTTYDNFLVIGDLNYDMLSPQKCTPLKNV
jgi:exonuclease III